MKNIIKLLFVLAFFSASQQVFAVCYTNSNQIPNGSLPLHPSSNGGALCTTKSEADGQWGGGQGVTLVTTQPRVQFVPVAGYPGQFMTGGNVYHCPALATWGGGFLGAILGNEIGKKIKIGGGTMSGGGAVIGAIAGSEIACDYVRPSVQTVAGQGFSGQTVSGQSNCDVGDLKGLKGLSEADCKRISVALAEKSKESTGATSVNAATGTAIPDVCAWIHPRTKKRFNKPAEDNRPCPDFVKEVANQNGYSIAYRQ